jgi:hypothetical protein
VKLGSMSSSASVSRIVGPVWTSDSNYDYQSTCMTGVSYTAVCNLIALSNCLSMHLYVWEYSLIVIIMLIDVVVSEN